MSRSRAPTSVETVPATDATGLTVAAKNPSGRIDRLTEPLDAVGVDVEVEPDHPSEADILVLDKPDRELAIEVLKKPLTDTKLVYRMRGDVFYELGKWGMHPVKEWISTEIIYPRVDGVLAVSQRLADKYRAETGLEMVGSAGLCKRVGGWPDGSQSHTDHELRVVTLTNANYMRKIEPIIEYAPAVADVLRETGGWWHVCGRGRYADELRRRLRPFDRISFEGFVDPEAKLDEANVMLHLSRLDGQPNAILEGMASGLPVVTNDFEAFTDYQGPLRIASGKAELQSTLFRFTSPERRRAAGVEGRAHVRAQHTPEAIGQEYLEFFTALLANEAP